MIVGYLRTSTNNQGKGLDAQKKAIEAYADSNSVQRISFLSDEGVSLVQIQVETVSTSF